MARQTSIDAYNTIKSNGLLSKKRLEVYEVLYANGPLTGMEIRLFFSGGFVDSQIRARLNEMRQMGTVEEIGTKICSVTNQSVILWDVTDKIPVKLPKIKKTKCGHCEGTGYIKK